MTLRIKAAIVCSFVSMLFLSGLVNKASAQPVELKVMHWAPTEHAIHKEVFVPWAKMLEEKSGGKIKVTLYPSELLGKAKDTYEIVLNGAADIGFSSVSYSSGIFYLNEVFSLPFLYPSMKVGSRAMWEHFEKEPALQAEFQEVKVLWFVSSPMLRTHTSKKPVKSLQDLKGLKLRTGGGTQTESVKALGAVPVIMGSSDVYTALERGTVDGLTFPWEAVKAYRVYEVTKFHNATSLWGGKFFTIMNKKKFQSLPPDIQKVIMDVSGAWGTAFASDAWEKADMEGKDYIKALPGHQVIDFTPEEEKLWQATVKPIWDEWVAKADSKKAQGRKILDDAIKMVEKYKK